MFDFHMHSDVSFDSECPARDMLAAAERAGLREICFTDHVEFGDDVTYPTILFTPEAYSAAYDGLESTVLRIRRGVEYGISVDNRDRIAAHVAQRPYDLVIGSIHCVDGMDPYYADFWTGRSVRDAYRAYLDETLASVRLHEDYDVLGHLTYACKSPFNPTNEPILYEDYREVAQEIMRVLVQKGKGMEINTSGIDAAGVFLPSIDYLRRFRQLGGEIVTVGSDAHNAARVGQYTQEAVRLVQEEFGYVCTYEQRRPIFHRIDA